MKMTVRDILGPAYGKYRGIVNFHGIPIGLELVEGDDHPYQNKAARVSYGEIPATTGVDGDPVDVILGDDWGSTTIYVLQDAAASDGLSSDDAIQYGEDKLAIGFPNEQAARQAHSMHYDGDNRKIVGVIVSDVEQVKARVRDKATESLPWVTGKLSKSFGIGLSSALSKARGPKPPAGYMRIPKTKHGGYRKKVGSKWIYWYPDEHKLEIHLDYEDDPTVGRGTSTLKPGQFVGVTGRRGQLFVWTPDAGPHAEGYSYVTAYDPEHERAAGEPERVMENTIQAQRSFDPESRKRTRKQPKWKSRHVSEKEAKVARAKRQSKRTKARPPAPVGRKRKAIPGTPDALLEEISAAIAALHGLKDPDKRAALLIKIDEMRSKLGTLSPGKLTDLPAPEAATAVFEDSTAKPGTYLHRLENGHYPLVEFAADDQHFAQNRKSHGVFVPKSDQAAILEEFSDVISNPAISVAKSFRIPRYSGEKEFSPEYEEILSGSQLGFILALRSYTGGTPFEHYARQYASVYAQRAARDLLGGGTATLPHRQMQMLHGLIAARNRARAKLGKDPNPDEIASEWYLTKKMTFTGRGDLGVYPHPEKKQRAPRTAADKKAKRLGKIVGPLLVDQGSEQVPDKDWRVIGPDGEERGKSYHGKMKLIAAMDPILSGTRVETGEWVNEREGMVIPLGGDHGLPRGVQHQLRHEIDSVLAEMGSENAEVLTVLFGLDPEDVVSAPPTAPKASGRGKERVKSQTFAIKAEDLADKLALTAPDAPLRTKQRAAKKARDKAILEFRVKAADSGFRHLDKNAAKWGPIDTGRRLEPPKGPTHGELVEKFGGEDRVQIYAASVRAGTSKTVAAKLEKWKAGKLSARDRKKLKSDFYEQRDRDRYAEFKRQTAHVEIDPKDVKDAGGGTPSESDWLYAPLLEAGMMQALANRGSLADPGPRGEPRFMSEERFARFMGRERQYEAKKRTEATPAKPKKAKTRRKR